MVELLCTVTESGKQNSENASVCFPSDGASLPESAAEHEGQTGAV